ncbi:MAG: hypothetical protein MPK06_01280 [Alphaproteobacteria bacterium]|nr:hypothetical protein [Alphaproteobacteria bacterium]MDA7987064.1 hypothetical protein [Alphaproteobacteria bacterium]MDA8000098.1 hypothetical protein [Alphaproteobacteria bacterium]MDA8004138.1 hypothetical protein [Alphaproteobacteria bacterium]MDA8005164.1 hypothetical protein [Alphaproteobacteria bacterium]
MTSLPTSESAVRAVLDNRPLCELHGLPGQAIDLAYGVATRAFGEGDYVQAANGFAFAATMRHTDSRSWIALARSLMFLESPEAASVAYRAALKLRPEVFLYAELARAELAAGDPEEAFLAVESGRDLGGGEALSVEIIEEFNSLANACGRC